MTVVNGCVGDATSPGTLLLPALIRPEGWLALHDPRHEGLRLLTDHGVYLEFIPFADADQQRPPRQWLDEVRPGVPYEVAISSPAGVWACRTGTVIEFTQLTPPLLRVLPLAVRSERSLPVIRAPHRQSVGTPAALPETPARSPWSARADRG